jgi:hypothetical protein
MTADEKYCLNLVLASKYYPWLKNYLNLASKYYEHDPVWIIFILAQTIQKSPWQYIHVYRKSGIKYEGKISWSGGAKKKIMNK